MARAVTAPDTDNPNGTLGHKHHNMSVLQQHVAFFDQDDNGIIFPWETYKGCRDLGFNAFASFLFMVFIHGALSYVTLPLPFSLLGHEFEGGLKKMPFTRKWVKTNLTNHK